MLDYEPPQPERGSVRALRLLANLSMAYPLVLFGSSYGAWLAARAGLGHWPTMGDNTTLIPGVRPLYMVSFFAMLGLLPAGFAAMGLNLAYAHLRRPVRLLILGRFVVVIVIWAGSFALIRFDPGGMWDWWFD